MQSLSVLHSMGEMSRTCPGIIPEVSQRFPGHSKTANNRTPGADNEYTDSPSGPGTGTRLCGQGDGFSGNRSSGKPLLLLLL